MCLCCNKSIIVSTIPCGPVWCPPYNGLRNDSQTFSSILMTYDLKLCDMVLTYYVYAMYRIVTRIICEYAMYGLINDDILKIF